MLTLAGQTGPDPGPFLLIWGLLALIGGGALATKKGSARFKALVVNGLEGNPGQQANARSVSAGFVRFIGGGFVVAGAIALPASLIMMTKG